MEQESQTDVFMFVANTNRIACPTKATARLLCLARTRLMEECTISQQTLTLGSIQTKLQLAFFNTWGKQGCTNLPPPFIVT